MLRDLRLLRCGQKLKADSKLLAQNGTHVHSTADRLERWREHFVQVSSVSVEVVMSVLNFVLEVGALFPPEPNLNAALTAVPSRDEVKVALNLMKNR